MLPGAFAIGECESSSSPVTLSPKRLLSISSFLDHYWHWHSGIGEHEGSLCRQEQFLLGGGDQVQSPGAPSQRWMQCRLSSPTAHQCFLGSGCPCVPGRCSLLSVVLILFLFTFNFKYLIFAYASLACSYFLLIGPLQLGWDMTTAKAGFHGLFIFSWATSECLVESLVCCVCLCVCSHVRVCPTHNVLHNV